MSSLFLSNNWLNFIYTSYKYSLLRDPSLISQIFWANDFSKVTPISSLFHCKFGLHCLSLVHRKHWQLHYQKEPCNMFRYNDFFTKLFQPEQIAHVSYEDHLLSVVRCLSSVVRQQFIKSASCLKFISQFQLNQQECSLDSPFLDLLNLWCFMQNSDCHSIQKGGKHFKPLLLRNHWSNSKVI